MCHHTHSDYQFSNPPLRLAGRVRGLRMICHTTNNPAPSISTARWEEGGEEGGLVLLLSLLSPPLYTLPRIRLVAPADMWTDSCQQDVRKQKKKRFAGPHHTATLGLSLIGGAANPTSLFRWYLFVTTGIRDITGVDIGSPANNTSVYLCLRDTG